MIDLTFNDSAAGALKHAKSKKHGDRLHGVEVHFADGKSVQREVTTRWAGEDMDGSAADVAPLTLTLDVGDLSDMDAGMQKRKAVLGSLFAHFPQGQEAAREVWAQNLRTLDRLKRAKETLEPVRVWVCAVNPAEMLGLYFVCHLFVDAQTPLLVVEVPNTFEVEDKNETQWIRGTGELIPNRLGSLAKTQRALRPLERKNHQSAWCDLVRENAPLRAIINGRLMGVPVDFYDFVLRAYIPEGDFVVARVIGNALGLGQVAGTTDTWFFSRLMAMVNAGELLEVAPPEKDNPYSGILRKR